MNYKSVPIGEIIRSTQYGLSLPADPKGQIPIVGMKDIQDGRVRIDRTTCVNLSDEEASRYLLYDGDILLNRTNSPDLVGKAGIYRGSDKAVFASYLVRVHLDLAVADPDYVIQVLASEDGQRHIKRLATRAIGQANLNPTIVKRHFTIPLPKLHEQISIRNVLVSWDTAIQLIKELIAAKEAAIRSSMRRLFEQIVSPRRRLSEITCRVNRKNTGGDGDPLTISGADGLVSQSRYFGKRIAATETEHYTLLKRGEFAYNRSYSAGYPLGAIKRLDRCDEGIVSTLYLCFALNGHDAPLSDYFAYFCESGGFNHQIYKVAQEGARNHGLLNVTAHDFFGMSMPVPPRQVQERVVRAFDAAHRELTLLREQLVALRNQKRGLMQKLLTGQWRLPMPEQEAV